MKRTVPFTKTLTFKTMIAEITDIEVTHDLKLTDFNEIEGDILVDGKYKMTDASQIEEEFHYRLPFTISIDSKYDTKDLEIMISDFYFEIINEEDLKINVEVDICGLEEKQEEVNIITSKVSLDDLEVLEEFKDEKISELVRDDYNFPEADFIPVELEEVKQKMEFTDTNPLINLEKEIKQDLNVNEMNNFASPQVENQSSVSSIFSSISNGEETFSTYYVYIVRESDTIDSILDKYKTTREELQNYNDLDDVKVGNKLIIPCSCNE